MQSVLSRIWTRVAVSISYDDKHYTTGTDWNRFIANVILISKHVYFEAIQKGVKSNSVLQALTEMSNQILDGCKVKRCEIYIRICDKRRSKFFC